MPTGCLGGASVIGVAKVGTSTCGLPGTFLRVLGAVPPAPFISQNTLPMIKVAQAS